MELTILMPCLNEEETIKACVLKAQHALKANKIDGEILIADNGSIDCSPTIAKSLGARVIHVVEKGYGKALRAGIEQAKGKYVIMGDSDDSYDFTDILPFVNRLRDGYDLVMGNRFKGGIEKNAMPFLHKYLGNPVLSFIGRLFFKTSIGDFHCGLRGFNRSSILDIGLCSSGMEFASEMIVKSSLNNLKISEVPIKLYPDGRSKRSHLRTWRDGWRHLRFLLLFSPKWLFLYPGLVFMMIGMLTTAVLFQGPVKIGAVQFDIHTMLYSAITIVIGFQLVTLYFLARIFAIKSGLDNNNEWLKKFNRYFSLEKGLGTGVFVLLSGVILSVYSFSIWNRHLFGNLNPLHVLRFVIPAVACLLLGIQIIFNSFFTSILHLKVKQ
ncbi:glycosyltransferase family 2 protein [Niastella caeni]|uniref:Glycosyltransferase family 2 protein n=1 Tax=Niastella caeni TaxID=2569763 RepID=A0A4S8I457_9BACT|nr:glycosyltransferase family 2 protein [Niastella caeni]THU41222.1 glycosyltransferase family 2 protein [Niastella caeni]